MPVHFNSGPLADSEYCKSAATSPPFPTSNRQFAVVISRLLRFARQDFPILLQGESGTGKTRLARWIHESSRRSHGPFQHVILSAMDDSLGGSDLFGHEAGAFTGARGARAGHFRSAAPGTVFLDEIAKASPLIQGKLLHAIETGEFFPLGIDRTVRADVRVVAATNVCLRQLSSEDRFLPDLAARLCGYGVHIPPLRDRPEDIPQLAASLVTRHAASAGFQHLPTIEKETLRLMAANPWRDNVRGLEIAIRKMLAFAEGSSSLSPAHYEEAIDDTSQLPPRRAPLSREAVLQAVASTRSISAAARKLGTARSTVYTYLKQGARSA